MLKKNLAPIFALSLIVVFFIQPNIVRIGAINGITLWYNKILPVLFPMFILSNILLQYSFLYDILGKISGISKKLLGSAYAVIPFVISIISGFPSGAVATDVMVKSKRISNQEGKYLLFFTNLCSFQFISAVIVLSMLKDYSLLKYIVFPHYISAFVLCKFINKDFIPLDTNKTGDMKNLSNKTNQISFNEAFSNSISKSIISILTVGGVIVIFSIIAEYIMSSFFTGYGSGVKDIFLSLIVGCLEMTNGCNIVYMSSIPIEVKIILINFLISFSGLSIIFQTISVINNINLNILEYTKYKFVHGILSALISIFMLIVI